MFRVVERSGLKEATAKESSNLGKEETKSKRAKTNDDYMKEIVCGICIDVMYKPVTLIPCLHSVLASSRNSSAAPATPSG